MDSQLSLFHVEAETNFVKDIRTEQQFTKKISYDVGDKIGGSRKDISALRKAFEEKQSTALLDEIEDFSAVLAVQVINKTELFKEFSLEKEKEMGTEPAVARAKQLLIQRVVPTPTVDSREARLQFMKAAQHLLISLEPVRIKDDLYSVLKQLSNSIYYERLSLSFNERRLNESKMELQNNEVNTEEYRSLLIKIKKIEANINAIHQAKELGLRCLGEKFCNFFKNRSSYNSTLVNAFKIDSWDELLTKKEKKTGGTRRPIWERTLPERPDRIGGGQSPIGKPEDLLHFFGYRGVEFGHYVDDEKGFEHLLRSSEAMMDLAEILGVDYSSLSHNGTLAMAYGARGRGGQTMAHYEPISKVINMTKEKGCLGVFAHEWWHSYDNRLYNLSHGFQNGQIGYASEPHTLGSQIDCLLPILFSDLLTTIKEGNSVSYFENTNKPGVSWRGTSFKTAYQRHKGDLLAAMTEKVSNQKDSLRSSLKFYSSYSHCSDKEIEKLKRRADKNIKSFALALAWYHEQETGDRVEKIPYPSDKSNYLQASISLDRGTEGKYWSNPVELTARAFEAYIQDKLSACGRRSDYLVAGANDSTAFPMGDEREEINKKFEVIMNYIKDLNLEGAK